MTTTRPSRQDPANRVSLAGKVTMNPVFGLAAPVAGQVRYLDVKPAPATPSGPTRVAAVWAGGKPTNVELPAGATLAADWWTTGPAGVAGVIAGLLAGFIPVVRATRIPIATVRRA